MSLKLRLFIQVEGVTECSPGGPLWPQAHDCLQVLALPGTDPATFIPFGILVTVSSG